MSSEDDKKDGGSFGSFKDLFKSMGGEPSDEAHEDEKPEDEPVDDDAAEDELDDEVLGYVGNVRKIMFGEGSFGPMTHGPPPYQDVESEEMELLASFRVRTVFPEAVLEEMAQLPSDPPPSDYEGVEWREDLRQERIFTIDGVDARDYDDAICIHRLDDGGYELSVHIADVSHYVVPGTALDREATARATSVYVADQVIPMLPEQLSNQLCSLVPDRERLAFSVIMTFDASGKRTAFYLTKSVIKSIRRCNYRQVQMLFDGVKNEETALIEDLRPDLEAFAEWTRKQQADRDRRGSLRMQSGERKYRFDKNHEVVGIYESDTYFSQTLIEETALAANQAVGDFFKFKGLPTIYRVHPEKDPEEIEKISTSLAKFGIRVPKKDRLSGRDIGAMIRFARKLPNAEAMIGRIMGLVERASYEVQAHDDQAGHWGLATEHYLHFTSPIRRYPDLVVHRMLFDVLQRGDEARAEISNWDHLQALVDVAGHASSQADLASMVEMAVEDLKLCQYMEPRVGEAFEAVIIRVSRGGLELRLKDDFVVGFLPARSIGNRSEQEGPVLKIISRQGTKVFREGDRISVVVAEVDFIRLKVLFELEEKKKAPKTGKKKKKKD